MENTRTKRYTELRGEKTVGTTDYRCQFSDFLPNSGLTHYIALVELNNPLSLPDSGSARIIVFSCFARLFKVIRE